MLYQQKRKYTCENVILKGFMDGKRQQLIMTLLQQHIQVIVIEDSRVQCNDF